MALNETDTGRPCSEARSIEALASVLDISIMVYDRNDTLIAASSQFRRFFDVSPELLKPGARLRDLFAATFDAGARVLGTLNGKTRNISREDWIAERIALHWRERYESVERLADGRWIRLCKRRSPDGTLISTIQDISDQKRKDAEMAEIKRKTELFQTIVDGLSNAVVVKNSELRYVVVNDAFCRLPGLRRKQILGRKAGDIMATGLAVRIEKIERDVLETGIPYEAMEELVRGDGTTVTALSRIRRCGTPGDYHVTVSLENIGESAAGELLAASDQGTVVAGTEIERPDDVTSRSQPRTRVLVVDEDNTRATKRVIALREAGIEAVSISSPEEVIAFLDAAQLMNLVVSEVDITSQRARALSGNVKAAQHQVLKRAIEQRIARDALTEFRTAAVPVQAKAEPLPTISVTTTAAVESLTSRTVPAPARTRVLVAEDNDVNQIVFEQILEGIGVDFRIVANGQEAVAAWRAAAPDLILMDISMPVMNGLQAAQAIRDAEAIMAKTAVHVPIIAVTAHAMNGDRERFLAAGMDDYLSKPVSPDKLEAIIQKWVGSADRRLAVG